MTVYTKIQHARKNAMQARGHVPHYGRQLAILFRVEGLVDVQAEGRVFLLEAGPRAQCSRLTIEQLRDDIIRSGVASAADIQAYYALLDSPAFVMVGPTLFAAWGRRPAV